MCERIPQCWPKRHLILTKSGATCHTACQVIDLLGGYNFKNSAYCAFLCFNIFALLRLGLFDFADLTVIDQIRFFSCLKTAGHENNARLISSGSLG